MTKITRENLPHDIINIFLNLLRDNLQDVCSPKRSNLKWIRSDIQYNKGKLNSETSSKGKVRISKPKDNVGFPQIAVANYTENNTHYVINGKMETLGDVTIRIVDNNVAQRIDSIAAKISSLLITERSSLILAGLSKLEWSVVPVGDYGLDNSIYNEKDIVVTFTARVDDGC